MILKNPSKKPKIFQNTDQVVKCHQIWSHWIQYLYRHPSIRSSTQGRRSVTRRNDCFSIFGHFQRWKFAHKHTNCTRDSWKLCPKLNKPYILPNIFKYLSKWWNSAKSGHTGKAAFQKNLFKNWKVLPWAISFDRVSPKNIFQNKFWRVCSTIRWPVSVVMIKTNQ